MSSLSFVFVGLVLSALLSYFSFRSFKKDRIPNILFWLTLSALILRLFIALSDPFLYDWDEKFHALVAKNMSENPFKPMLFVTPIFPYEVENWCCNHIWTHKPPLFLWLIALSIKTFGVKVISVRIPSIVLGSLVVPITYDISRKWLNDHRVAFLASILYSFSFYQVELISGRIALDHNDVIFQFFVIASIWGFVRFNFTKTHPIAWATIIGIMSGAAILTKWLVGLLVYFGWIVLTIVERKYNTIRYLALSVFVVALISLPWQLYISYSFPAESKASYNIFYKHITEKLGTNIGDTFYHIAQLNNIYDYCFLPFIIWGVYKVIKNKALLTIPILSMISVVYVFFSLIVSTKMPSFTTIVSPLIWILVAVGVDSMLSKVFAKTEYAKLVLGISFVLFSIISLKPWDIIHHRSSLKKERLVKVHNSNLYRNLGIEKNPKNIIINCKAFDNIDIMFYTGITSYPLSPNENAIDSLSKLGYQFYAFNSHNEYILPDNIQKNKNVIVIDEKLK